MEIITITIDGRERRFLKDRLETYLKNNPGVKIRLPNIFKKKEPKKEPKKEQKKQAPYVRVEKRKVRTNYTRKGLAVIVTYKGENTTHISLSAAAGFAGISKGFLSKILSGANNLTGFQFKKK